MAKVFKSLFILLVLVSLVGCATAKTEPITETIQEEVEREMTAPAWLVTPSASVMSDEEFAKLQERVTVSIIEEPEETIEVVGPPVEEIVEEVVEKPAKEIVEEVVEPVEEVVEESLVNILADKAEEPFIPEQEKIVEMPEVEYEFAGEDYRDLSFVLEKEPQVELSNIEGIENTQVVTYGEYVEEINPEIITAMSEEYKALEEIDMAEPTMQEKLLKFAQKHLLIIEVVILVLAVLLCIRVIVKRNKKATNEQKEEVADEGEEIVQNFQSYRAEVRAEAKEEAVKEEAPKVEDYEDDIDEEI